MYYQPHIAEQYYPPPPPQVAAAFNDYYCNSSNQHSDSRSLRHRKQRKPRKLTRSLSTGTISPQQAHYQVQLYNRPFVLALIIIKRKAGL
jgi:hypothetical protein